MVWDYVDVSDMTTDDMTVDDGLSTARILTEDDIYEETCRVLALDERLVEYTLSYCDADCE